MRMLDFSQLTHVKTFEKFLSGRQDYLVIL